MVWQKNETRVALTDIRARFYMGDAQASPPNVPRVAFDITTEVGIRVEVQTYDVAVANATSLTPAQKTELINNLASLLTESLTSLGFVNV